jgi:FtsP/CotA-like multicopper oxidase with cupredoxin domain
MYRAIALAVGLAAALAIILAGSRSSSLATTGDSAYKVPLVTDTNPAPNIVETTLTAEQASVDLGQGVTANNALTFNGTIPGPTFMLNVGDHVIVHFQNRMAHESGIHWHGVELSNGMDGTPFTQNMVPPGGDFLYEFTVNRPGFFWYHPHHHSSTNQVFHGMYGMIIVKDPNEDALQSVGTLPSDAQTFPLVLSDTTVCKTVNDTHAYDDNAVAPAGAQPWAGGGGAANTLPPQPDPSPKNLCEGPAVNGDPYPIDENGTLTGAFAAGDIPNIQPADSAGRVNEGQTVLTNGRNVGGRAGGPLADQPGGLGALAPGAELLDVQPGQGIRFEVLNSSTVRFMRLQLTDPGGTKVPLFRVGGEGGLLNHAVGEGGMQQGWNTKYDTGEILIPPGTRADVVAAIPTAPTTGVMTLWTRDYDRTGGGFSRIPTVPVAHLNLTGPTVTPAFSIADGTPLREATGDLVPTLGAATGTLLNPATFTPPKTGMAAQTINFTQVANASLGVDGVLGAHEVPANVDYTDAPHMGSTRYAKSGDILQLTVGNTTGADHPFHLHGFSIQPILLDGPGAGDDYNWTYPEFRDNVDIPKNYKLTFRVRLDPRPMPDGVTPGGELGRWLFHCHIFFHTEDGMISELVVTDANGNEAPTVAVTGTTTTADQLGPATMKGTYDDRDGDAVTLSASTGTVTDDGGGRWTWNETVGAEEKSSTVFITATDSKGNKGQAPFDLVVNPKAPTLTNLKVSPAKFFPSGADTAPAKKGANITLSLSKASTVSFLVHKIKKKPKVGDKTFTRALTAGNQTIPFTAKFAGKRLKYGKYSLTAMATDADGLQSAAAATKFKIKQKPKKKHHHH